MEARCRLLQMLLIQRWAVRTWSCSWGIFLSMPLRMSSTSFLLRMEKSTPAPCSGSMPLLPWKEKELQTGKAGRYTSVPETFLGKVDLYLGLFIILLFSFLLYLLIIRILVACRAIRHLDGKEYRGRPLVVEESRARPPNSTKVFVGNISATCSADDLHGLFASFGRVLDCDKVKGE